MVRRIFFSTLLSSAMLLGISMPTQADSDTTHSEIVGFGGKCLDLPFGNLQNGTDLWMWECNGTHNQNWASRSGRLKLRDHCLDGEGPTKEWGTPAQIYDCVFGASNQRWTMTVAGEIISKYSGQCLDLFAWDKSHGAKVVLWPCNGQGNQKWILKDAQTLTQECNGKYIHSVKWDFTDKGLVLRIDPTHTGMAFAKTRTGSAWKEVKACTPPRYSSWSFDSAASNNIKEQFYCHARFAINPHNSGKGSGGEEWELESYNTLSGSSDYVTSKCGNKNPVRMN